MKMGSLMNHKKDNDYDLTDKNAQYSMNNYQCSTKIPL